jgi:site-specific recombinase XerD
MSRNAIGPKSISSGTKKYKKPRDDTRLPNKLSILNVEIYATAGAWLSQWLHKMRRRFLAELPYMVGLKLSGGA